MLAVMVKSIAVPINLGELCEIVEKVSLGFQFKSYLFTSINTMTI